jgi:putative ABC transport system permease protein
MKIWLYNRYGAMVGDKIEQKNGCKVGQRINLGSQIYPQQSGDMVWSVVIEAIYKSPVRLKEAERVLIHYDYFNETRMFGQYTVSWFSTKLTAGANVEVVANNIDKLFIHSPNATKTQTETEVVKAFISQIGNVGKMITFVLFIAVLSMLVVIFSNLSQSFSDRLSDLAVMSVLGFSRLWIIKLVVLESLFLIVSSAILGLFIAFLVVHLGLNVIYQYLPNITIEYSGLYQASISAVGIGIIVSSIPIIKLISTDLIASLNKS